MISLLVLALATAQVDAAAQKHYADILSKNVANGRVAYASIDSAKLDLYLKAVGTAKVPEDRSQAIAFYVDAYNAYVLRAVLDHKRPRSVLDVKDFFDEKKYLVAGKTLSLNQLEKEQLNPFAKDPRTHFVLVCAAVGCPILEDKPYAGSDVNARLEAATRRYLSGPTGAIAETGALKLSMIFSWYAADFVGIEGGGDPGVLSFVKKYLPAEASQKAGNAPKISYLDYNWTLNQQ